MYIKEIQNKELKKKPIFHPSTINPRNSSIKYSSEPDVLTVRQLWFYYSISIRHFFLQTILSLASFYLLLPSKMVHFGGKKFSRTSIK